MLNLNRPSPSTEFGAASLARIPEGVEEINTRVELIQMLIPLGLMHVNDLLQQEVETLAGKKYGRKVDGQVRWGGQPGSVYLGARGKST